MNSKVGLTEKTDPLWFFFLALIVTFDMRVSVF